MARIFLFVRKTFDKIYLFCNEIFWYAILNELIRSNKGVPELIRSFWTGSPELWRTAREVILEGINSDGTFLDVGCANGVLVRDLRIWVKEKKGFNLTPYGIDIIKDLVNESRENNPGFEENFVVANKWSYKPQRKFTFIYISISRMNSWKLNRLVKRYLGMLQPKGRLILSQYDDCKNKFITMDNYFHKMGAKLGFFFVGKAEIPGTTQIIWLENRDKFF